MSTNIATDENILAMVKIVEEATAYIPPEGITWGEVIMEAKV